MLLRPTNKKWAHYFDIRKQILKYDDIANEQRTVLYQQRNELLELDSIQDQIFNLLKNNAMKYSNKLNSMVPYRWQHFVKN